MTKIQFEKQSITHKMESVNRNIENAKASLMMAVQNLDKSIEEASEINRYSAIIVKENEKMKQLKETLELLEALEGDE